MSLAATSTPSSAPPADRPLVRVASAIGLIVAVLALPVVLLADGPFAGWLLGTVLWCANWGLQLVTAKRAMQMQATAAVGVSGVSFIARAWLVAIVLFVVALRFSEPVGLAAAGVFLAAFTCDLVGRSVLFSVTRARGDEAEA